MPLKPCVHPCTTFLHYLMGLVFSIDHGRIRARACKQDQHIARLFNKAQCGPYVGLSRQRIPVYFVRLQINHISVCHAIVYGARLRNVYRCCHGGQLFVPQNMSRNACVCPSLAIQPLLFFFVRFPILHTFTPGYVCHLKDDF